MSYFITSLTPVAAPPVIDIRHSALRDARAGNHGTVVVCHVEDVAHVMNTTTIIHRGSGKTYFGLVPIIFH